MSRGASPSRLAAIALAVLAGIVAAAVALVPGTERRGGAAALFAPAEERGARPGRAHAGARDEGVMPAPATERTTAAARQVPAHLARPIAADPAAAYADEPPPSAYDLTRREARLPPEDRSLMAQLWRTVVALAVVVLLIYGIAKLVLPRLAGDQAAAGSQMHVIERLTLGPKHALVLVEVAGGARLVVGLSDGRVTPVAQLPQETAASFAEAIGSARPLEVPRAHAR